MPEVRAALLIAAEAHLARRPWSAVRMGEVAASAGVSRQTLYNEFGSKEGLVRALARQAADGYLAGIERALARPATDPRERLRAAADWTVAAARPGTLLRSLLTGCWGDPLPAPRPARTTATAPAQRRTPAPGPRRTAGRRPRPGRGHPRRVHAAPPRPTRTGPGVRVRPAPGAVQDRGAAGGGRRGGGAAARAGHWVEPESWRPMTPQMTRVMETIFRTETTSPRKTMP